MLPKMNHLTVLLISMGLLFTLLNPSAHVPAFQENYSSEDTGERSEIKLQKYAELAQETLDEGFWNESLHMFANEFACGDCNDPFHYWWQAHAIDVLVDGYERTKNDEYLEKASLLFDGIMQRNDGIVNDFYDDMLWMGLAVLRLYDHTGHEEHEEAVLKLWGNIKTGWNDAYGGGISWNKFQRDYKNTPSNAPAVILAARLFQRYKKDEYLEWAEQIFTWLDATLVDETTGIIWDGINREGDGKIDKDWLFTYNHGIYIGAALELFYLTGEEKFMEQATQTGKAVLSEFVNDEAIIYESDSGDGGLFKGILVRYLAKLAMENDAQQEFRQVISASAESAWNQTESLPDKLFGTSWLNTPYKRVELSQQLSGVMLMEQAAFLESHSSAEDGKRGLLSKDSYWFMSILFATIVLFSFFMKKRRKK